MRKWKLGDKCGLIWRGRILTQGTILTFYGARDGFKEPYALVQVWKFQKLYPLSQLVPVETTKFTFRHLFATLKDLFFGNQRTLYRRNPRIKRAYEKSQ